MEKQDKAMDDIIGYVNEFDGFGKYIGIEILEAHDGMARAQIKLEKHHFNPIGSIHGGLIFSIADTVSGVALHATGKYVTTLSSNISYLRPAMQNESKYLIAEGKPIRMGRHISVMEVSVKDDLGREIARCNFEFYVLGEH